MPRNPGVERYLESGLQAAMMRQTAIMNNMANLNTPGYRRWDVDFQKALARQMDSSTRVDLDEVQPQLVQPKVTPLGPNNNDVDMEHEVGQLIRNTGAYKTYMRMLNKVFQQMRDAMRTEG